MLYVIDQRLKAQGISLEKSAQGTFRYQLKYQFSIFFYVLHSLDFDRLYLEIFNYDMENITLKSIEFKFLD